MGLFSKQKQKSPTPLTPHQQRDRLIEGSLNGVTTAEQMLQQAQTRKAEVIKDCISAEQADMAELERQINTTNLRLQHLANLGGDISETSKTE